MTGGLDLGRLGIWTFALDTVPVSQGRELAAELDELGYGALWLPEAIGRNPMAHAALLGTATRRMVMATGVANVYARDAMAMRAAHETLTDAFPDRVFDGTVSEITPRGDPVSRSYRVRIALPGNPPLQAAPATGEQPPLGGPPPTDFADDLSA